MFAILVFSGDQLRSLIPLTLIPLVSLFLAVPHFGATMLRVYERAEDRRRYVLFGIWASLAVWVAFGAAVHSVLVGSILFTLYLSFGPWHYTGQNYGIALIFLRRRGIEIDAGLKRWIYASYVLSFVLTLIVVHEAGERAQYQPIWDGDTAYHLISAQLPGEVVELALLTVGAGYLLSLVVSIRMLLARAPNRSDLVPYLLLTFSQALWFTIPLAARQLGLLASVDPLSTEHAVYAFMWVAIAHSVQYLWISTYYQKRSPGAKPMPTYLLRCWLAGAALWALPALLFAPGLLGKAPFDDGLELMVAVAVNIQHFILDAVIWKLRDGRVARALLRSDPLPSESPVPDGSRAGGLRPRHLAPALGAAAVLVLMVGNTQGHRFHEAVAEGDIVGAESALRSMRLVGRDSAEGRLLLATAQLEHGNYESGLTHAERAYDFQPGVKSANNLAWILATDPRSDPDRAAEAVALAESALAMEEAPPPELLDTLAASYASAGRFQDAERAAQRAIYAAQARSRHSLAQQIQERFALYQRREPYRALPTSDRPAR